MAPSLSCVLDKSSALCPLGRRTRGVDVCHQRPAAEALAALSRPAPGALGFESGLEAVALGLANIGPGPAAGAIPPVGVVHKSWVVCSGRS